MPPHRISKPGLGMLDGPAEDIPRPEGLITMRLGVRFQGGRLAAHKVILIRTGRDGLSQQGHNAVMRRFHYLFKKVLTEGIYDVPYPARFHIFMDP
jgi:hypothetical protein